MLKRNKQGALEMSVGTIVVIVIAMAMLILGLVLVRTIFTGSIYNVQQINEKVKGEINGLFRDEGRKSAVHLPENRAQVNQGKDFGVAFGIKNIETGTVESSSFSYEVVVSESVSESCTGLTADRVESWIKSRRTRTIPIAPGDVSYNIVRFEIPEDAPLCIIPFDIIIEKDGAAYTTDFFDLVVE
jgi:hypothetical protein